MNLRQRLEDYRHRHYGTHLFVAAALLASTCAWLPGPPGKIASPALVALMIVGMLMDLRHWRGPLCEECIKTMPLNAAERAQERRLVRWSLTWMHYLRGSTRRLAIMLGALSAVLLAQIAAMQLDLPSALGNVAGNAMIAFAVTTKVMTSVHARYQPWCPYCRDDGDDDDWETVPDPVGGHGRPRPA